jgi:hypothetical protein
VISVTFRGYLSALATSGRGAAGRTGLDAPPLPVGGLPLLPAGGAGQAAAQTNGAARPQSKRVGWEQNPIGLFY